MSNDLARHAPGDQQPDLEGDPRWLLARRIASSPRFRRAGQLRAFLIYICTRALTEMPEDIPESEIAVNVLKRRGDFNPNEDNIVRVQARQLRRKLQEYFENEGSGEEFILTIPKGRYLPEFLPQPVIPVEAFPPPTEQTPAGIPAVPGKAQRWSRAILLLSGLLAVAWIAVVLVNRGITPGATLHNPLWRRIFGRGQKTSIVVADTSLVMLQMVLRTDITLRQYLSRDYPANLLSGETSERARQILTMTAAQPNTDFGDLGVANGLFEVGEQYGAKPVIRYARNLNARDFKNDNFVLTGSRRSIPWDGLFESELGYVLDYDTSTGGFSVRDRSSGKVYRTTRRPDGESDHYGVVAMVPNLGSNGSVLLLMGLTMEAVEGSGEVLESIGFPASISRAPGCGKIDFGNQWFEMVVKTRAVSLTPSATEVLGCRVLTPSAGN
jgi:hypothetical protein